MKKSPLAVEFPAMPSIDGVRLATAATAAKYRGRDDVLLVALALGTVAAGVLTQSGIVGAPVQWCRRQFARYAAADRSAGNGIENNVDNPVDNPGEVADNASAESPRALLVNAGHANVFTGAAGARHVLECCQAAAAALSCRAEQVLAASTGVIGEPLAVDKIIAAVPQLAAGLASSSDIWQAAAAAITTTDTFAKGATAQAMLGGRRVTINGIAKGSGMIEPNMATMLAFMFTDAALPRPILQALLAAAVENSFNAITVDGDASTSDACLLFATGAAGKVLQAAAEDAALDDFRRALGQVAGDLAQQIVRDGEGAQKFITVEVRGAQSDAAAKIIAKSIANSPLVKTAMAGADANWGRIVMAIGKCGQRVDAAKLAIAIGGIVVTEGGRRRDDYAEGPLAAHLKGAEITIQADLRLGCGQARVWTCDLTHGYIDINADYRS